MSQNTHWRDRAITASEVISDGFEVLKAYGARIAEWILFFCLFANILEMFPLPEPFAGVFGNIVLAVQVITLDIAGFGLTTMGDHAERRGDVNAAKTARRMGWTLISLMILTVGMVTVALLIPPTRDFISNAEKVLMLARVIVTVLYGHIVHRLRSASTAHENRIAELEKEVGSLRGQLQAKQQEASTAQQRVSTLQSQLDTECAALRGQLGIKQQEIESLHEALGNEQNFQSSRVFDLQEEVKREQARTAALRSELNAKQAELERVQLSLPGVPRNTKKIVSLPPRETGKQNTQDVIYALLDKDETRGPRELARLANVAPATAKRHRDAYFAEQNANSETPQKKQSAM